MKTILITGGAGFIGSNLVRRMLQDGGYRVVCVDKLSYAGNLASLSDFQSIEAFSFEQVDLCQPDELKRLFEQYQPSAVMHLAAESHVDRSIDGPGEFIQTNIVGTYNLLQASLDYWRSLPEAGECEPSSPGLPRSRAVNVQKSEGKEKGDLSTVLPSDLLTRESFRFLHVSTDEVFGSLSPEEPAFSESTPYDPHSPYSASKAASDHLVRAWHDTYGLPILVTNCSNNYGPFQFPEKLIPVVILKCLNQEPIPVYGKGENVRDWLYVEDHCSALHVVLERGRVGETYVVGGNNERRNIDLVRDICAIMDELMPRPAGESYEGLISFVTDRPGHDMRYAIDASKIRDELAWCPDENNQTGMHKTVQWYLDNRGWWENILSGEYKLERLGSGK